MDTPAKRSAIERAGLSNTKARSLFAGELAKEGKTGGDFRKLTRSEQRGILSRVLGKLRSSAKKPAEEQPVLEAVQVQGAELHGDREEPRRGQPALCRGLQVDEQLPALCRGVGAQAEGLRRYCDAVRRA